MSKRGRYKKQYAIERVITISIADQHESVYLARRKTTRLKSGDNIHIKQMDITDAPWMLCRVVKIEGDPLPVYHVRAERPNKPRQRSKKRVIRQVVRAKINRLPNDEIIDMQLDTLRPSPGQVIRARPKYKTPLIAQRWYHFLVKTIEEKGTKKVYLLVTAKKALN